MYWSLNIWNIHARKNSSQSKNKAQLLISERLQTSTKHTHTQLEFYLIRDRYHYLLWTISQRRNHFAVGLVGGLFFSEILRKEYVFN